MRKIITPPLDDENLSRINSNFEELFRSVDNTVGAIAGRIWDKIVTENTINLETPVNITGELTDKDKKNTIRYVKSEQKLYVYNGTKWMPFEDVNYDPYQQFKKELDVAVAQYKTDLTSQLNLSKKELNDLNTSIKTSLNTINTNAINTVTQLKNDVANIKATFESDYTTKDKAFNDNYTSKLASFDANYTTKLNTFNSNSTTKITDFNNNYTAKLNAFNTNYDSKVTTLNTTIANATKTVTDIKTSVESIRNDVVNKKINGIEEILEGDNYYITKYENGLAELNFTYAYTATNTKSTSNFYYYDIDGIQLPAGISFTKVFSTSVSVLGNGYLTGGISKDAVGTNMNVRVWSYRDVSGTSWTIQISVLGKYK
ncbi:TPA: hypothetical protein PC060_001826 [Staphylococcus aureus]|nr:hypothetical protein [Staphylococcus aureus]